MNAQQKLTKELKELKQKNDIHWDAYEEGYQDAINDIEYRLKMSGLTLHFNRDSTRIKLIEEHSVRKHL